MSRKVLMVIAPDQFRDEELSVPRSAFQAQGWQVDVASTRTGEAKGMLGAVEKVEKDLNTVLNNVYDAVVVVGGMGSPEYLWNDAKLHGILQALHQQKKVIAAICLSGAALAKAGLLNGKQATVWEAPESLQALKEGGAQYTGQPVTVDGNIVTANGPEAAQAFAEAVIERVNALIPA
ncbi:MAG TPA: DJ-1/PfpI family protein [Oculatellaceae cyanobacterium]|jgi:protease I